MSHTILQVSITSLQAAGPVVFQCQESAAGEEQTERRDLEPRSFGELGAGRSSDAEGGLR